MGWRALSLFTAATAAITAGVWLILPAAALITAGALGLVFGVLMLEDGRKP